MPEKSIPLRPNATDQPVVHRQAAVRYAIPARIKAQVVALKTNPLTPSKILDISTSGISLLVDEHQAIGTMMIVEISNTEGDFKRLQIVKVVHISEIGACSWILGGQFANPLSGDEIQTLLS